MLKVLLVSFAIITFSHYGQAGELVEQVDVINFEENQIENTKPTVFAGNLISMENASRATHCGLNIKYGPLSSRHIPGSCIHLSTIHGIPGLTVLQTLELALLHLDLDHEDEKLIDKAISRIMKKQSNIIGIGFSLR